MAAESTHPAFIDRIEGDTAVLLLGEEGRDPLHLPRAYLPPGAGEGTHLQLRLTVDPEARVRTAREVDSLMDDLLGEKPAEK
jgi:Protein of unknown function (DUF3006)